MWSMIKDVASITSDTATSLAFVAVAIQLWLIRRQNRIESHQNFVQTEREIWLAALQNKDIAPNVLAAFWSHTPDVEPSEELFLAILMDHYEHQFFRYQHGYLSEESWFSIEGYIVQALLTPPANEIWEAIKKLYDKSFVEYFDEIFSRRINDSLLDGN
jgi:hypothetical protein